MKRAMNFQIAGIILLMIAEIHYGAYDDSLVSVLSAGHGLAAVNGAAVAGYNSTYAAVCSAVFVFACTMEAWIPLDLKSR